jgi:acetyl esterase/lipase
VLTARDDPMRDESLSYARRLRDGGVAVHEHTICAPTQWPDALGGPPSPDAPWAVEVRDALVNFFAGASKNSVSRQGADHD